MSNPIKVKFVDFFEGFDETKNLYFPLLSERFDLELSDNPDLLFYSYNGDDFKDHDCHRIFYTGENIRPNFKQCDYAFSFDHIPENPRNYRLPLYFWYDDVKKLTQQKRIDKIIQQKTKFCAFVVSNKLSKKRNNFFKKLSKYKKVDSGGKYLNNVGGPVADKRKFLKDYKFTISFENNEFPGYTTEKIFEPRLEDSIPIYWGNPLVNEDFNTKSFINYYDFKNEDEMIDRIIEIDQNEELYREYLSQPFFTNNKINKFVDKENIFNQFAFILEDIKTKTPIAKINPEKKKSRLYHIMKNKIIGAKNELKFFLPFETNFDYNYKF